jgi:5-methylcytosine-specific restriction endonuclease McrA
MPDTLAEIPKLAVREPVPAQKRKPLTRRQFAELILRQEGRCGCGCGERLKADEIVDEHLHALNLGGGNELTNRSLWRKQCSQKKTDEHDKPLAAKGARLRGETCNGPKRKIQGRSTFGKPEVSTLSKAHRAKVRERIGIGK